MRELEPLVAEFRQLAEVAKSFGRRPTAAPEPPGRANSPAPPAGPSPSRRRRSRNAPAGSAPKRAPRGQNREAILKLVAERPGISNGEIAEVTGIGKRVVASAVSKYKRDGLIAAEGNGVRVAQDT